jgi:tRNA 5-methylaminomethyl-2-thiouridine biosynthesis bifunctional protein
VRRLVRRGELWQALDADGEVLAQAPVVVLCNAMDALRLAGLPPSWLQSRRGQVSWCAEGDMRAAPRMPVAGGGYLLRLPDGRLLIGATNQVSDDDVAVRAADHEQNIARAAALIGRSPVREGAAMAGRVGWRASTRDRLPLIGPVPDMQASRPARRDAARLFARQAGLFVHSGLGSRGITIAPLGAALIAAQVTGTPWPIEADLADAIDPARFMRRDVDQAGVP